MEQTNEIGFPVRQELTDEKPDLLNRQEFVDRLLNLCGVLHEQKKTACFSINGRWGTGKSFVLDMFQKQAREVYQEESTLPKYLVFRYNCWEYDFYDEPLIAIVAALKEQMDEQVNLLSEDAKAKIKKTIQETEKLLIDSAMELVSTYTKIPVKQIYDVFKKGTAEKAEHSYDHYFGFRKQLNNLRKAFEKLAKEQTLIIVVDELDRCLPSYTIKVLERLHHLFYGIPNIQVIIAVDKRQLSHSVQQIYGNTTDVDGYLRKFIEFETYLDEGHISDEEQFNQILLEYTESFPDKCDYINDEDITDFKTYILDGIDMRKRISLIERCQALHMLINDTNASESRFLCLELFLALIFDCDIDISKAQSAFSINDVFSPGYLWRTDEQERKIVPQGLAVLSEKIREQNNNGERKLFTSENRYNYLDTKSLLGQLLIVYRQILGFGKDEFKDKPGDTVKFVDYGLKFWNLLQIIH